MSEAKSENHARIKKKPTNLACKKYRRNDEIRKPSENNQSETLERNEKKKKKKEKKPQVRRKFGSIESRKYNNPNFASAENEKDVDRT